MFGCPNYVPRLIKTVMKTFHLFKSRLLILSFNLFLLELASSGNLACIVLDSDIFKTFSGRKLYTEGTSEYVSKTY